MRFDLFAPWRRDHRHQWHVKFSAIHTTGVLSGTGQHGGCENLLKDLGDLLGVHGDKRSAGRQSPLEPGCRREREKSPTSNISNANELFLPSSYSCIGGTMAVIHSGADKIRGLGKSLLVKRGWKQSAAHVLSLSCHPSLLTNHSLLSFSLFKKKAHVLLFKSQRPWKAYMGRVRPPRWRLPHAFKLSLCALCESRPTKSTK